MIFTNKNSYSRYCPIGCVGTSALSGRKIFCEKKVIVDDECMVTSVYRTYISCLKPTNDEDISSKLVFDDDGLATGVSYAGVLSTGPQKRMSGKKVSFSLPGRAPRANPEYTKAGNDKFSNSSIEFNDIPLSSRVKRKFKVRRITNFSFKKYNRLLAYKQYSKDYYKLYLPRQVSVNRIDNKIIDSIVDRVKLSGWSVSQVETENVNIEPAVVGRKAQPTSAKQHKKKWDGVCRTTREWQSTPEWTLPQTISFGDSVYTAPVVRYTTIGGRTSPILDVTHASSSYEVVMAHSDKEDAQGLVRVSQDSGDNVIIQETQAVDVSRGEHKPTAIKDYCSAPTAQSFEKTMERWIIGESVTWPADKKRGEELMASKLPLSAIALAAHMEQAAPFKYFAYFTFDEMIVKLVVSGMDFITGQCMAGFYYGLDYDVNGGLRNNPYSLSQTISGVLSVAQSNSLELRIPYKSYRPQLNIRDRSDAATDKLYLGTLIVTVLNQLSVPQNCTPSVVLVPHIRFLGARFEGMLPDDLKLSVFEGHMWQSLAFRGVRALWNEFVDPNRDKPPETQPSGALVPQSGPSMACGTNITEFVKPLRLDAIGQTCHSQQLDEMQVQYISQIFGYVKTCTIKADAQVGDQLLAIDGSPVWPLDSYEKVGVDGVDCYYVPPVAVLSECYQFRRGSWQVRFDFVATRYHHCKVLVAFLPGVDGLTTVTLAQAKACMSTEYALGENNNSFTFDIPYISDTPWWPRQFGFGVDPYKSKPLGKIVVMLLTPLTYTCSVPSSIEVNIYLRGGPDFELSVPVAPTFVAPFNLSLRGADVAHEIRAKDGYWPCYVGNWRNLEDSKKCILRYGPVTDHVAQFQGVEHLYYYKFAQDDGDARLTWRSASGERAAHEYAWVGVDVLDGYGMVYLAPIEESKVTAYFYKKDDATKKWVPRATPDYDQLVGYLDSSDYGTGQWKCVGTKVPAPTALLDSDDDFVEIESQTGEFKRDAVVNITPQQNYLQGCGYRMYGERFMDLKDVLRRYSYLGSYTYKADLNRTFHFKVPILPIGPVRDPYKDATYNYAREGLYHTILSGYRFFTGSIRIKIVIIQPQWASVLYVMHRADEAFDPSRAIEIPSAGTSGNYVPSNGYAMDCHVLDVNRSATFEIPFYVRGEHLLLQEPPNSIAARDVSNFFSLGYLYVGVPTVPSKGSVYTVEFQVWQSFGDDARCSTFQGFPPMAPVGYLQAKARQPDV